MEETKYIWALCNIMQHLLTVTNFGRKNRGLLVNWFPNCIFSRYYDPVSSSSIIQCFVPSPPSSSYHTSFFIADPITTSHFTAIIPVLAPISPAPPLTTP